MNSPKLIKTNALKQRSNKLRRAGDTQSAGCWVAPYKCYEAVCQHVNIVLMTSAAHEIHPPCPRPPTSHPRSASVALCFAIPQITRYILYYIIVRRTAKILRESRWEIQEGGGRGAWCE